MEKKEYLYTTAIFAGSFCPPTNGHMNLVERGSRLFDRLVVAVLSNPSKVNRFSVEERVQMLKKCTAHLKNVEVISDSGLLVDVAKRVDANVILRGVRGVSDLEYEMTLAIANREQSGIETMFLPCDPAYSWVSSTIVSGYAMHGGDVTRMVPKVILEDVLKGYPQGE